MLSPQRDFVRCEICKDYHWTDKKCKPAFEYNIPVDGDEDWQRVRAMDFQEAAEKACEKDDIESADYSIASSGSLEEIRIRNESGEVKRFFVEAETVAVYHAKEIE